MKGENIEELLGKAKLEEEIFNWEKSAEIYNDALFVLENKNNLIETSKICKKLGYVNGQAADTMDTIEKFIESKNKAINYYKRAGEFFNRLKNKAEELECLAEALYEEGCKSSSINEGEKEFKDSLEYFIQSNEEFIKIRNNEGYARTLIRAANSVYFLLNYAKNSEELEDIIIKGIDYADKAWICSKKLNNNSYLIESLYAFLNLGLDNCFIMDIPTIDNLNKGKKLAFDFRKWFERIKLTYELAKDNNNLRIRGIIHWFLGFFYVYYGFFLSKNINEQEENIERGLDLFEKGLEFIKKTKNNAVSITIIFFLNWFAFFGGKINYVQK
ncbi:MAG: hypothetical protein ACFFDX_13750, partial [Candidatus Odinarchaeota archaeon]